MIRRLATSEDLNKTKLSDEVFWNINDICTSLD